MDDFLVVGYLQGDLPRSVEAIVESINRVLPVSKQKSLLTPSKTVHYVGYVLDFERGVLLNQPAMIETLRFSVNWRACGLSLKEGKGSSVELALHFRVRHMNTFVQNC